MDVGTGVVVSSAASHAVALLPVGGGHFAWSGEGRQSPHARSQALSSLTDPRRPLTDRAFQVCGGAVSFLALGAAGKRFRGRWRKWRAVALGRTFNSHAAGWPCLDNDPVWGAWSKQRRRAPLRTALAESSGAASSAATVGPLSGDALDKRVEELRALRVRPLRAELQALGVSTDGCVDKESLLELLETEGVRRLQEGPPAEPEPPAATAASNAEPATAPPSTSSTAPGPESDLDDMGFGATPAAVEKRMEELRGMRLRQLKEELSKLKVRTEGCVDKESLLEVLERQGKAALMERYQQREIRQRHKKPATDSGTVATSEPVNVKAAADPEQGVVTRPIYTMRGVDQAGVKAMDSRYIGIDVEAGKGAYPCRFVLDTGAAHSVVKMEVAQNLLGTDIGTPSWADTQTCESSGMRQYSLGHSWMGKLDCGELEMVAMPGNLLIPVGACGILGLDFIRLFDWDFDFEKMEATVATAPKEGPMRFDTSKMRSVPLMTVRAPKSFPLLAAPSKLRHPGGDSPTVVQAMSVMDVGAAFTVCNQPAVEALGFKMEDLAPLDQELGPEFLGKLLVNLAIGAGPSGPLEVEAPVVVGDAQVFEGLNMGTTDPLLIVGLDVLGRSRMILSTRLSGLWVPL